MFGDSENRRITMFGQPSLKQKHEALLGMYVDLKSENDELTTIVDILERVIYDLTDALEQKMIEQQNLMDSYLQTQEINTELVNRMNKMEEVNEEQCKEIVRLKGLTDKKVKKGGKSK